MAWFNRPTEALGHRFASRAEAARAVELRAMEKAGSIRDLVFQPRYALEVNGYLIGHYTGDAAYVEAATGRRVVEDVKPKNGYRTRDYRLRKNLMLACHGVAITEVAG